MLEKENLLEYHELFIKNGFEDLSSLYDISNDELKEIGITKMGHRKKLLKYINKRLNKNNKNDQYEGNTAYI